MARGRRKAAEAIEAAQEHLNGSNRTSLIREACQEIAGLEAERSAIDEQIRKVKQTKIKSELGMKIADFNAAFRLYKLEGDDRQTFFATLRETFEALGVGGQLDWLDALDVGDVRDPEATFDE